MLVLCNILGAVNKNVSTNVILNNITLKIQKKKNIHNVEIFFEEFKS